MMNSSYISSSIFNDKYSHFSIEDDQKIKSLKFSHAFKSVNNKDFTAKLSNLMKTRDNLRKANLNAISTNEEK